MSVGIKIFSVILIGVLLIGTTIIGGYWILDNYRYRNLVDDELKENTETPYGATSTPESVSWNEVTVFGEDTMLAFSVPSSYVASQSKEGGFALKDPNAEMRVYIYDLNTPSVPEEGEHTYPYGIGLYVYVDRTTTDLKNTLYFEETLQGTKEEIQIGNRDVTKYTQGAVEGTFYIYAFLENKRLILVTQFEDPDSVVLPFIESLEVDVAS